MIFPEDHLPEQKGEEILELLPEGICKQNILLKDGRTFESIGKWQYDIVKVKTSSYDYLSLEGIIDSLSEFGDKINPHIGQDPKKISSGLPVERTLFGHIKISLYGDQGIYYHKID